VQQGTDSGKDIDIRRLYEPYFDLLGKEGDGVPGLVQTGNTVRPKDRVNWIKG